MYDLRILIIGAPASFVSEMKRHFTNVESFEGVDEQFYAWVNNTPFQKDLFKSVPFFRTPSVRVPVEPKRASVIVFYEGFFGNRAEPHASNINMFKSISGSKEPPTYLVVVAASYGSDKCREFLVANNCDFDGVFSQAIDAKKLNDFFFGLANSRYRWVNNFVRGSNTGITRFLTLRNLLWALLAAAITFFSKAYVEEVGKSAGGATWKSFFEMPADKSKDPNQLDSNTGITKSTQSPAINSNP
jgi:hypothetical protein